MALSKDLQKRVNKQKLLLMTQRNTVFFSALLAAMKLEETDKIPTMATDGISILMNHNWTMDLPDDELLGVLLHETYHTVYKDMERSKLHKLDNTIWNVACDFRINGELDKMGYKLPKEGLLDHKYDGWSAMQIYNYLFDNAIKVKLPMEDLIPAPEGQSTEQEEEITNNIVKAVVQAQLSNDTGSIPGELKRMVEEILNPTLPWNQILWNYLDAYKQDDYTWRRPNRRMWPDLYLPSLHSEGLGQITIGIDVSGSIKQKQLDTFMAEIRYIWEVMAPDTMRVMSFDTHVRSDTELHTGDCVEDVVLNGGGGTNMNPLIQSIKKDEPEFAVVFSDMEVSEPDLTGVLSEIFWIRVGKHKWNPSLGQVIDFEPES